MARIRRVAPVHADGIGPESLRPAPTSDQLYDVNVPAADRIALLDSWLAERHAWTARRAAHEAAHGWSGGTNARTAEENLVHPIPDEPFDPNTI